MIAPTRNPPVGVVHARCGPSGEMAWARFEAVEKNLIYSDRPRNGPAYWFPIILIRRKPAS